MRSSAPNPFGTSLIDLLVGALAIVAMLWVLNAPNTGYTGSGEEERTSGSFSVEQYGAAHFRSIRIRHGSWWEAEIVIGLSGEVVKLNGGAPSTYVERASGLGFDGSDPKRFVYTLPDPDFDDPTTVTVVAASPGGNFRRGLHVVVENLSGPRLQVNFHIAPCCDPNALHFLETTVRSGNGDRKDMRFWHEAGMLQQALSNNHNRYTVSGPTNNPDVKDHWIQNLEEHILGDAPVRTHTFHLDAAKRFYSAGSSVADCVGLQLANDAPGILRVRFEPDGDVSVKALDSNEAGGSSASSEPAYLSLMSGMDTLVETLPSRIIDNAP